MCIVARSGQLTSDRHHCVLTRLRILWPRKPGRFHRQVVQPGFFKETRPMPGASCSPPPRRTRKRSHFFFSLINVSSRRVPSAEMLPTAINSRMVKGSRNRRMDNQRALAGQRRSPHARAPSGSSIQPRIAFIQKSAHMLCHVDGRGQQSHFTRKFDLGRLQLSRPLNVHLPRAVDQYLGDRFIFKKLPDRGKNRSKWASADCMVCRSVRGPPTEGGPR